LDSISERYVKQTLNMLAQQGKQSLLLHTG
jgi:hypothetical protein